MTAYSKKYTTSGLILLSFLNISLAQEKEMVRIESSPGEKKVDIFIGGKPFTTFIYTDSIEKPVLYPIYAANGTVVTRGFPLDPKPDDPTDHPHHLGLWLNFENINGLDFWNNSYAIAKDKKQFYGWIKTDKLLKISGGETGILSYHANWTNQQNDLLLEETTRFEFSGTSRQRIVDRITVLKANTAILFTDAKDGLLGLRLAHELQIPTMEDQKFSDDKGNVTIVKGGTDTIPNGTYLTSEGKQGNDAWSTRGRWCKVYGRMGKDSISIAIIDHPKNPNYPTFWHARGYGLFAANPLGEKIFTNGKSVKNLQLKKGESVTFRFRILVDNSSSTCTPQQLDQSAEKFSKKE
jgi:Methane oxygenase PmoA